MDTAVACPAYFPDQPREIYIRLDHKNRVFVRERLTQIHELRSIIHHFTAGEPTVLFVRLSWLAKGSYRKMVRRSLYSTMRLPNQPDQNVVRITFKTGRIRDVLRHQVVMLMTNLDRYLWRLNRQRDK